MPGKGSASVRMGVRTGSDATLRLFCAAALCPGLRIACGVRPKACSWAEFPTSLDAFGDADSDAEALPLDVGDWFCCLRWRSAAAREVHSGSLR